MSVCTILHIWQHKRFSDKRFAKVSKIQATNNLISNKCIQSPIGEIIIAGYHSKSSSNSYTDFAVITKKILKRKTYLSIGINFSNK